jgi:hypothetical protein
MTDFATLSAAVDFAQAHAEQGLRTYPFDAIYQTTIAQVKVVRDAMRPDGTLGPLPAESVSVGLMAAKELGNDERDFAHALHVIQRHADTAMTG